jgi:hypothetical protein
MPWGPLFLLLTLLHRTFSLRGQGKRKIGYLSGEEYLDGWMIGWLVGWLEFFVLFVCLYVRMYVCV